jgi:biuret amidohydrolase
VSQPEVCAHTTVREASDRGYRCVVIADCCASYFPEFHEVGLRMISAQGGIFGWVGRSAEAVSVLMESPPTRDGTCLHGAPPP